MTLRKWFHIFWTTLFIGIAISVIMGLILQITDQDYTFLGVGAVGYNLYYMTLGGAMISVLSQMGFFAYLIVRFIAAGILRSKKTWDFLQLALVIIVLFDLVYLRYSSFAGATLLSYSILPAVMLILSLAVAYFKVKATNNNAFIPTLFFMTVVTILEAVPALKLNNTASSLFMLAPLFACNAWQILILHKVLEQKKS